MAAKMIKYWRVWIRYSNGDIDSFYCEASGYTQEEAELERDGLLGEYVEGEVNIRVPISITVRSATGRPSASPVDILSVDNNLRPNVH